MDKKYFWFQTGNQARRGAYREHPVGEHGEFQGTGGMVMINLFNPRSDVVINGKRFELEIQNFWQSRWSWKFNGAEIITYTSNEFLSKDKGEIELYTTVNDEVEILILLGLFVRNQFILFMLLILIIIILILL